MRGHFIKRNHATQSIRHAIWTDTETNAVKIDELTVKHVLFQGWAAYSRWEKRRGWSKAEWFRYETKEEYWTWVYAHLKPRTKLYMFVHNSGFDYPVLDAFGVLFHDGWKIKNPVLEGPPTIINATKENRSMVLLDTLNWWRTSLKALGKSIGLEKLDMPDECASTDDWDTYNKRDVEIIMRAVQSWCDFLREYDLGGFASTLAGQSLRTFRHRFMKHRILIDNNKRALECSRACYHGGRCESWFIGKSQGNYHLLDVNSMYPFVMQKYKYPTILQFYTKITNPKDLIQMMKIYLVCARVRVKIDEPGVPFYNGDKLLYPVGEFDCALSTPQLEWVIKHGNILKVYDMSMYSSDYIFKEFVDYFYGWRLKAKQEGDELRSFQFKKLLNSLYGKFGQRGFVFDVVDKVDDNTAKTWIEVDIDSKQRETYRQVMGLVMKLNRSPESGMSHPAIAAHVTAYASMYLYELACLAGRENVLYMDTDSLLLNDNGYERVKHLEHQTELGKLKNEATYNEIEIHGPKDYKFGMVKKIKGISKKATEYCTGVYEQEKWVGLKGLIRAGKMDAPLVQTITKRLRRNYDKGYVTQSGRVEPFRLS